MAQALGQLLALVTGVVVGRQGLRPCHPVVERTWGEKPVENAIGYSPILDALEEVAVKALFGSKREARCF